MSNTLQILCGTWSFSISVLVSWRSLGMKDNNDNDPTLFHKSPIVFIIYYITFLRKVRRAKTPALAPLASEVNNKKKARIIKAEKKQDRNMSAKRELKEL